MKINHLLATINEAGPRSAAQQASMQSAASGVPSANNPFNLRVVPGGRGTTPAAAPQSSTPSGQTQPGYSRVTTNAPAGIPSTTMPAGVTVRPTTPQSTPTTTPTPQATPSAQPSKLGQIAKSVGKAGVAGIKAAAKAAPGAISAVGNVGSSAVQAAGNIAAQGVGGIGQALGAAGGGLVHGYKTARSGNRFQAPTSPAPQSTAAAPDEINDLKSRLDRIEQLLARRP